MSGILWDHYDSNGAGGIRPKERLACTNYQHEGSPLEGDEPCTECGGTGWVPAPKQESGK